jgi:Tfp pilus assembly protein PilN
MNNYINLVQSKDEEKVEEKKRIKILNVIAASFLTIIVFCAIIIFIISSQFSLSSIKRDQNAAIFGISQLKNKAGKLITVNDRLRGISDILDNRKDYSAASNALLELVPQGISIKAFSLNKDNVKMTVSSDSLLLVNSFLNTLIDSSAQKKVIKDLVMEGIIFNIKKSEYVMSISGTIL